MQNKTKQITPNMRSVGEMGFLLVRRKLILYMMNWCLPVELSSMVKSHCEEKELRLNELQEAVANGVETGKDKATVEMADAGTVHGIEMELFKCGILSASRYCKVL